MCGATRARAQPRDGVGRGIDTTDRDGAAERPEGGGDGSRWPLDSDEIGETAEQPRPIGLEQRGLAAPPVGQRRAERLGAGS